MASTMTKVKFLLQIFLLLALASCDPHYEPKIRNSYGFDVAVTLAYSDGESRTNIWPRCRAAFVGSGYRQLEKVAIAKADTGVVIREFSIEEIRELVEKQKKHASGYSVWSVGEEGVKLIRTPKPEPRPS